MGNALLHGYGLCHEYLNANRVWQLKGAVQAYHAIGRLGSNDSRCLARRNPSQRAENQNDEHKTIRRKCPTSVGIQISMAPDSVRKNVAIKRTTAVTVTNLRAGFSAIATKINPNDAPLMAVMTSSPAKNHHGNEGVGALNVAGQA